MSAARPETGTTPATVAGDGPTGMAGDGHGDGHGGHGGHGDGSRGDHDGGTRERPLPPVTQLGVAALVLVIAAGIYLAAETGRHPSLVPAIVALVVAAALVLTAATLLARVRDFAWGKFRMVFGWALLEYAVIAGMLVYIFVRDSTPAGTLGLFIAALVIFAVDIPLVFGFSVARYQPVPATTT